MRQYFVVTPFASLGDQTTFPIATDPNGYVSFQQGWGPDYAADPATDANAKDIDRASTNWLMYIVTNALSALQGETIPEWITAADNNGTAFQYAKGACVLYSASGNPPFTVYRSLVDANVSTPGADNNWQVEIYQAAAGTDVAAGTSDTLIVTPLSLKSYPGNSAQAFSVGSATALTQAPTVQQVQRNAFNYAGVAGGTANAITATLAPAPTTYTDDLAVVVRVAANNTGAVTLNVNGLGAIAVVGGAHQALQGGELVTGGFACFAYSTSLSEFVLLWATGGSEQVGAATNSLQAMQLGQATGRLLNVTHYVVAGSLTYTPTPGTTRVRVRLVGGGGAGGNTNATVAGQVAIGGGGGAGGYAESWLTSGFSGVTLTIGAGGTSVSPNGGTTSFGALLSATGGLQGASGGSTVNPPPFASIGGNGGAGSGANIANAQGAQGLAGVALSSSGFFNGGGGASQFGAGALAYSTQTNTGAAASSAGAGGAGGLGGAGVPAQNGGAGAAGAIIIEEFS